MAYRLKLDEKLDAGFHRVAGEQFKTALDALGFHDGEFSVHGIHECRKALKRLRALVRLFAPGLGEKSARRRRAALADIARLFAQHRDHSVVVDMLSRLRDGASNEVGVAIGMLSLELTRADSALAVSTENESKAIVRDRLAQEARNFEALRLRNGGTDMLRVGLRESYRAAKGALKVARRDGDAGSFHTLRKTLQWHWRQMNLLTHAWPAEFSARAGAARALSQILGDDHDISLVVWAAKSSRSLSADQQQALLLVLEHRQTALRRDALLQSELLLAERSGAFSRRAISYWKSGLRGADCGQARDQQVAPALVAGVEGKSKKAVAKASA